MQLITFVQHFVGADAQQRPFSSCTTASAANGSGRIDKMRDEIDARLWDEHGRVLSEDLDKLFKRLAGAARKLTAVHIRVRAKPTTNS
jgi:hypothetical protein